MARIDGSSPVRAQSTPAPAVNSDTPPPQQPAAENKATPNQPVDSFEDPKPQTGPNLDGGSTPPVTFKDGNTTVSSTTDNSDGSKTKQSVSTGNGNVAVSNETTAADGSKTETSVKASSDGVQVGGSSTTADGTKTSGSVKVGPGSVDATAGVDAKGPGGLGVKFQTNVKASDTTKSEGGYTTTTVQGELSVTLGASVKGGVAGFSAEQTDGVKTSYQVRMKDEDAAKVKSGQAPTPDPYNPDTLPVGSSVLLNSSDFKSTQFEGTYRNLSLQTKVTEEQGVSVAVEKTGANTVRVTAGPTDAITNSFKLGLSLGPASVNIGNSTSLKDATLKTAEFDLSTQEGRAAYNDFLVSGKVPEQNGTGVQNVATVQKIDYDSTSSVGASLGPLSGSLKIGQSTGSQVVTTYPDGSKTQSTDVYPNGGLPIHIDQKFNPDGSEDTSQQRITASFRNVKGADSSYLYEAFTGDQDTGEKLAKDNHTLNVTFTPDQANQLSQRARDYIKSLGKDWHPVSTGDYFAQRLADAKNPLEVATALADIYGGNDQAAEKLLEITFATSKDKVNPLPGTLEVK